MAAPMDEPPSVSEDQNKKWLAIVKEWLKEQNLQAPSALPHDPTTIYVDFKMHEEKLVQYLRLLDEWLINNGVNRSMSEMPSLGRLLAQLLKVPLTHLSASLHKTVLSCILHLSDLLHPADNDDNTSKRAKEWAIDHLQRILKFDVDAVGAFLIEEFGVSKEEYLREHLEQSAIECANFMQDNNGLVSSRSLGVLFEILKMAGYRQVSPLVESIVKIYITKEKEDVLEKKLISICEDGKLFSAFSLCTMDSVFKYSIESFEAYVVSILDKITDSYPRVSSRYFEERIDESRLIELCQVDVMYFFGIINLIKESILVIGVHYGLVGFLRSLTREVNAVHTLSKAVRSVIQTPQLDPNFMKISRKYLSCSPRELHVSSSESDVLEMCAAILSHGANEVDLVRYFDVWFQLIQHADYCYDRVVLLLFQGTKPNIFTYLSFLIYFMYPTVMGEKREACVAVLTSYVNALRNLSTKSNLQVVDLQFLTTSLDRKIAAGGGGFRFSGLLIMVTVVFLAKSCSGDGVAESHLGIFLSGEGEEDADVIYWFLYGLQLLNRASFDFKGKPLFRNAIINWLSKLTCHNVLEFLDPPSLEACPM